MTLEIDAAELANVVRGSWDEETFQSEVIKLAHDNGWKVAHFRKTRTMRRDGSIRWLTPVQADGTGFPDLVLVKSFRPVLFVELKSKTGRFSPEQVQWARWLASANAKIYAWRPDDWQEIVRTLSGGEA